MKGHDASLVAEQSSSSVTSSGKSLEVKPVKKKNHALQDSPSRTESSEESPLGKTHDSISATTDQYIDNASSKTYIDHHNALDEAIAEAKAVQDLVS